MYIIRARKGGALQVNVVASLLMLALYFFTGGNSLQESSTRLSPTQGAQTTYVSSEDLDQLAGNVAGKVIILDPGHGGPNPGAIGVGPMPEKDVVLHIAYDLKAMLEYAGAEVILTRSGDYDPGQGRFSQLKARTRLANNAEGSVFVSIHANWHKDSSVRGAETYYYTRTGKALADSLQGHLVRQTEASNLGSKFGNFYVLRNTRMPAALVEVGFVSNRQEAELLAARWYQEKIAKGIYFGLEEYFARR